ncbi:MAG TPA: PmoA family protein [Chloroflexota bacterium]|nr:PmoA family protein [Chloroflexota bacterium]
MPNERSLIVNAGEHPRQDCPVWLDAPTNLPNGPLVLRGHEPEVQIPVQRIDNRLLFVVKNLAASEERTYELVSGESAPSEGVKLVEGEGHLAFSVDDQPFTTYHFAADNVRPFLYPVLGPSGLAMTRNFPMVNGVAGESTDHPHHRSLYVAFGEVNGVDVWAESPHPNTGRIIHQGWQAVEAGVAAAYLNETLQWVNGAGFPLLDEQRQLVLYRTSSVRLIDLEIVLRPARFAVLFGDTKEGGPLALRVASELEGKRGGLIQNAFGGRRESECWGKPSPWVDYSGQINGTTAGVAIMDHPSSFRHPTTWHVRDYGLFAANPFGLSEFTGDPDRRGDYVLPPGRSITFRYRISLHLGDADAAKIADQYQNFAHPPNCRWL